MATIAQLTGADAVAVAAQATANGAAKNDLSNASTAFLAIWGGTTSAFPALRRSGNTLDVRTADDSTSAALTASVLVATSYIRTLPLTVSTLPSASATGAGSRAFVSDANATTFNSVVAAGGSNSVPVFSDGANWRIG